MRANIPNYCFVESECLLLDILYYIKRLSMASTGKTHDLKNNFLDKTVLLSEN